MESPLYFKNKGITQTTVEDNHHHKQLNEIKWDADYNGKNANIKLDVIDHGKKNKYRIQLSNKDLANMLSIPSTNIPIDKRLEMDFLNQEPTNPDCGLKQMQIKQLNPQTFILPLKKTMIESEPEIKPEPILFRVNIPKIHFFS